MSSTPHTAPGANPGQGAPRTLHTLVGAQVRRTPDAIAVRTVGGPDTTYAALFHHARATAFDLRAHGVRAGARVGVTMRRGPDLAAALLAVSLTGAAWVPLEPSWPAGRIRDIIDDASIDTVLHDIHTAPPPVPTTIPLPSAPRSLPVPCGETRPFGQLAGEREVPGQSPAYLMYTSGSTGRPKGVVVTHHCLTAFLRAAADALPLDAGRRVLIRTAFSFDVSVMEMFWPLACGAGLAFPHHLGHHDPDHLAEVITTLGVTDATFVPTQLNTFLATEGVRHCHGLRRLVSIGEALHPSTVAAVHRALPNTALVNAYGPTEATVATLLHHCTPTDATGAHVPIGRPLGHTGAHVVDPGTLEPRAPGQPGELVLTGPQIAPGYHHRPELTHRHFLPDTFTTPDGSPTRAYRTGDTVVQRPDGNLVYLGREDRQVKIRGHRIELGDVEHALRSLPDVLDAHADLRSPAPDAAAQLTAWAVTTPGHPTTGHGLRRALLELLPAVSVPDVIAVLAALPVLTSGKLDRSRLPDPFTPEGETGLPAPAGESECVHLVKAVWADVLGHHAFADYDTFFDAGGTSLQLLAVQARLNQAGHPRTRVLDLLEHPTPLLLGAHLARTATPEHTQ
ncbi:non-ribosomal peptide synthetase [Kitasatospora purpeofusca]|uniref:non-ribosomal peptide synthetase n=1 Tax=Kitasatospora purpeofusca TaxID=67352 RepID=UPI0036C495A6